MMSIRTILHPTDFNESSENALRFACALASEYDANLVIVHVVASQVVLSDGVIFLNLDEGHAELREELEHLEIPAERIDIVRRLEQGNPAAEILNLAQLCRADLIVMGTHRRGRLTRWFMGSVAEAVMREATCPVLIATSPVKRSKESLRLSET